MFLTRIIFGKKDCSALERDDLKNKVENYLSRLLHNGQIYGEYLCAWHVGTLVAYTHLPRPDALSNYHHAEWHRPDLEPVLSAFGQMPQVEIIDDDLPDQFPNWENSSFLFLSTDAFNDTSPIRSGDTGRPIPLYLMPITQEMRESIYFWARSYKNFDNVWIGTRALEIPAYKQLAEPSSELSQDGLELCAKIEAATKIPTYYYLFRYWGRIDENDNRPCPMCGGIWRTSTNLAELPEFHQFAYRCDACRIVSHAACSTDDQRHARIGEFKKIS